MRSSARGILAQFSVVPSFGTGLLLLVVATVATLFFTAVNIAMGVVEHEPIAIEHRLIWQGAKFYLWAAFAPVVIALARRHAIERRNWIRPVLFHLFAAVACSLVITSMFLTVLLWWPVSRQMFSSLLDAVESASIAFSWSVLIYWAILLATNALDNYHRYRSEQLRSSQLQAQLAEAQLRTLRMQLQPHFLFNTLHSLSDLVLEDARSAVRMIAKLGDFLRLTIEAPGEQIIPLRQELEFARSYLEIEQIRFHDRLEVVIAAEPPTYAAHVPNLLLQPIVENAVRHGAAARVGAGKIAIKARRNSNQLQITIQDNGPGLRSHGGKKGEGVGLANTRARLRQLYGEEQSLELASSDADDGGTVVLLKIPFVTSA